MLSSCVNRFFETLEIVDGTVWSYLAVPAILLFGICFSTKSRWIQIFGIGKIGNIFKHFLKKTHSKNERGIHPLYAFFAAIGGCIGVGNIIGVCTAVQIGGPGAVFWMWVGALLGMIIKYSEIYLGVKYRVHNAHHGYDGGPMYYLKKADRSGFLSVLFCLLMCIYGAEIYIFRVVTSSIVVGWGWNHNLVVVLLLAAILGVGKKGLDTVGHMSSIVISVFLVTFASVAGWVFYQNLSSIPGAFSLIFKTAFTGHAAAGAFAGSGILLTMSSGIKRACYSGDIGVGYASIIHSESAEAVPEKQAALGIVGIFLDTFVICTISVLLIIVTGLWNQGINENFVVAQALSKHIPSISTLWPFFIFLLGYSTLIAFFTAGRKAAEFLWPRHGSIAYSIYATLAFLTFSFVGTSAHVMTIMSMTGALLLLLNLYGIFRLRKNISFVLPPQ